MMIAAMILFPHQTVNSSGKRDKIALESAKTITDLPKH
jgi:hypothetical protein